MDCIRKSSERERCNFFGCRVVSRDVSVIVFSSYIVQCFHRPHTLYPLPNMNFADLFSLTM